MSELLTIVDENDNVIKGEERKLVHSSEMWHRAVNILIFNSRGELLIQKRSADKDKYPNAYDFSASGHVDFGEDYETAALREMEEELGIKDVKIEPLLHCRSKLFNDYEISMLYRCIYDGKIKPNEEVAETRFSALDELKRSITETPEIYAPWTIETLRWYFGMKNKLEVISTFKKV